MLKRLPGDLLEGCTGQGFQLGRLKGALPGRRPVGSTTSHSGCSFAVKWSHFTVM